MPPGRNEEAVVPPGTNQEAVLPPGTNQEAALEAAWKAAGAWSLNLTL